MRSFHQALSLTFVLFLVAGCQGQGDSTNASATSRTISNPPTNVNGDASAAAPTSPSETRTDTLRIGRSTSLKIKFPGNFSCVDGQISWQIRSDQNRGTLDKTDICEPTLTTTAEFEGRGDLALTADLRTSVNGDTRLIRWDPARVELKEKPTITVSAILRSRNAWKDVAASTWQNSITTNANLTALQEVTPQGESPTAQMEIGIDARNVAQDGGAFFLRPATNRSVNREFAINLNITDPQNDMDHVVITGSCAPASAVGRLYTECPFEFDPVDPNQLVLRMRLKLSTFPLDPAFPATVLSLKRVFLAGTSQNKVTDIVVEARHPETSEVARAVIGKIILFAATLYAF